MNEFHHPVVWAGEPRPVRAKEIVRTWWKPAACATVIAVLGAVIVDSRGRRGELPDFAAIEDTDERKAAFIDYLAPVVREANREVEQIRTRLRAIDEALESGMTPGAVQRDFVRGLAAAHGIEDAGTVDRALLARLLHQVDTVPVSLAVAQAAIESGWGTSRFARKGNNLYGMRDYTQGAGMVPRERAAGENFEVATFAGVRDGVRAYIQNLNTHGLYRELRELRERLRAEGVPVTGERLSEGLHHYSEGGPDYMELVRSVIRQNGLGRFDE